MFECFLTISQRSSGLFEHGSVSRDRAHAVCTAVRLVAGCDAMWRPSGGKNVQTFLIGSPWFAWFGDGEHMANQIDQNPNQFLTKPNQFSPDPNQFSQIANRHVNQFSQIANLHANQFLVTQTYIPFRANRLQTDAEPFETPVSQRLYSAMTGITVYCLAADLTISGGTQGPVHRIDSPQSASSKQQRGALGPFQSPTPYAS